MKTNLNTFRTAAFLALASVPVAAQTQTPKSIFPLPAPVVSTVPSNGDVNPYGVFFVPKGVPSGGVLASGDILVSNFNNSANLQGKGTTIIRVSSHGAVSLFFQGKTNLGLTAALGVLKRGLVFVGNLPTVDGTPATVQAGSLLVIDRKGNLLGNLTDPNLIDGPWGMAIFDQGGVAKICISNVLNGTITRLDVAVSDDGDSIAVRSAVRIASGYNHRLDPAALVLGPSGLSYDAQHEILYVASSADNAVYAVHEAGSRESSGGAGNIIYQDNIHLHGPIDLVQAPNGHLIVANSDGSNADPNQPSELVEFTVDGKFIAQYSLDKNDGGAFGVALAPIGGTAVRVAAVDDNANTLSIWTEPLN